MLMNSLGNTVSRILERLIRIEPCTVVDYDDEGHSGVLDRESPDSKYWNTVTVSVRNVKPDNKDNPPLHRYCIVLQHDLVGNGYGHPYMPRVGDLVLVLFLLNQKPIVLGTLHSNSMKPVCRAPFNPTSNVTDARYDEVHKLCQHELPSFDEFKQVRVGGHWIGKKPTCSKWFHKSRDFIQIFECVKGHEKFCDLCTSLDHIVHTDAVTFFKHYASGIAPGETISTEMPAWTDWYHHHCGSQYWFKDDGTIKIENWTSNVNQKGHIFYNTKGSIDAHSEPSDLEGSRVWVLAEDDDSHTDSHGTIKAELIYITPDSYVRIYEDGSIVIKGTNCSASLNSNGSCSISNDDVSSSVSISALGDIDVTSPTIVTITAPVCTFNCDTINIPES